MPDKFAGSSADYSAAICRVGRPGCFSQIIREKGDESHEAGVYGTVRVEFYIEPDGTITLVGASESPHPALTEHVQKLILDTSGQWTPLLEMGHPCRYLISFPVNFDPGESTSYATGIPL